jgi:hypothetical protein
MAVCHGGATPGPDDLVGGGVGGAGIELMKGITRALAFRDYVLWPIAYLIPSC